MPVYLEVVPTNPAPAASGTHTLEGSQCLVFYLGGVPAARSRHPSGVNMLLCDGSVRFAKDLDAIAAQVAQTPIRGGIAIVGPSSQPGYATTRWQLAPASKQVPSLGLTSAGGPAVLIGLLLPAVQAAREAARRKAPSAAIQKISTAVGPSGQVFVVGSDGALVAF